MPKTEKRFATLQCFVSENCAFYAIKLHVIAVDIWLKIGLLRKFQPVFPRSSLRTIYKTFIPSHFDYVVAHDQNYKSPFRGKLEPIEYDAAVAIEGATRGPFTEKLYQEYGLEFLQGRQSFRKLCQFYKFQRTRTNQLHFFLI